MSRLRFRVELVKQLIMTLAESRITIRFTLDCTSDFIVHDGKVVFRKEFQTEKSVESFRICPDCVVDAVKTLLTVDLVVSVAKTVHDGAVFCLGCNRIPLFALETGGRDMTLYKFRCVFDSCSSFLQVRLFTGVFL